MKRKVMIPCHQGMPGYWGSLSDVADYKGYAYALLLMQSF